MKNFFFIFALLAVSFSTPAYLAHASSTSEPELDNVMTPVDAPKATISGTAEPFATILVTGGLYEIPSVKADADGEFAVIVALVQEEENIFFIQAQSAGESPSDLVEIRIEEGVEVTQEYEASTGNDHTAPDAPEVEETTASTEEDSYTIEGTGEEGAAVLVDGEDSGEEVDDGAFSVTVDLSGNGKSDSFNISLEDRAGNLSGAVKVTVTSDAEVNTSEDGEVSFSDIEGHWAKDYIMTLAEEGVVTGYPDGSFGPDKNISRAEIVKIMILAMNYEVLSDEENPFSDLEAGSWYKDYVLTAHAEGIVNGYSDGTFRPGANVTRAEALKIILEAAGLTVGSDTENFPDVLATDWFASYTAYAKAEGIISGYSDGSFKGNQSITRAEAAKIIVEMIETWEEE